MRIIMDDAGDIPTALAKELNIFVVPINVMFGTEQFLSGVDMDRPAFYRKTGEVTAVNFPKTSQPTPYQFAEVYKKILAEGEDEMLAITVSEKLSGTYESAIIAAKELAGQGTFHVFDSQGGSAAQGYMALAAARMAQDGADIDAIMARLKKMRDEMSVIFTIDSLEYARKGGRVSNVKSVMASMLNIKPILELRDGLIEQAGQVRTRKKAMNHIVDYVKDRVGDQPIDLAVIHANALSDAQVLCEQAKAALNTSEVIIVDMAISVAINLGPGALGLVAMPSA